MSDSAQLIRNADSEEQQVMETKKAGLQGLPLQSSPYLRYTDLEEYKFKAYGTNGHIRPKLGQGGGAMDASTKSGNSHFSGEGASLPDSRTTRAFPESTP